MTKPELARLYDIKLELLEEVREERNLMFDLWRFYIDKGIKKSHRYTKQLDKLHEEINVINDDLTSIRVKLEELKY